jgi:hypothetical protein
MHSRPGPATRFAFRSLCSLFQATASTRLAGNQGSNVDGLGGSLSSLPEGDMRLNLDAIPNQNLLLLERAPSTAAPLSSSSSGKAPEEVLKIEIGSETACSKSTSPEWPSGSTTEWIAAG